MTTTTKVTWEVRSAWLPDEAFDELEAAVSCVRRRLSPRAVDGQRSANRVSLVRVEQIAAEVVPEDLEDGNMDWLEGYLS